MSLIIGSGSGVKSLSVKFESLTEAQKRQLKGEKGDKGDPLRFEDLTPEQKQELEKPALDAV